MYSVSSYCSADSYGYKDTERTTTVCWECLNYVAEDPNHMEWKK